MIMIRQLIPSGFTSKFQMLSVTHATDSQSLILLNQKAHTIMVKNHFFTQQRRLQDLGELAGTVMEKTSRTTKTQ